MGFWNKWDDFWLGKEVTNEYDVGKTVATLWVSDGVERMAHNITREGFIDEDYCYNLKFYPIFSTEVMRSYLNKKGNFYVSDNGKLIPIHQVQSVELKTESLIIKHTFRQK